MNRIVNLASLAHDRRWKHWAKLLQGVDRAQSNGYAFDGPFLSVDRKHELPIGSVILHYHEEGSTKYHSPQIDLWQVTEDGLTLKYEKRCSLSWALDVRDEIADLLPTLLPQPEVERPLTPEEEALVNALANLPEDRATRLLELASRHRSV